MYILTIYEINNNDEKIIIEFDNYINLSNYLYNFESEISKNKKKRKNKYLYNIERTNNESFYVEFD